jgi:hypothetical protein
MVAVEAQTLRLPLSRRVFQVRGDGYWRERSSERYEDELTGRFEPRSDEWGAPTELLRFAACAERAPGAPSIGPTWWLVYGNVRDDIPVRVTLADGQQPVVQTFGPLWLCEWVSEWQAAVVSIGQMSRPVFDRIPPRLRVTNNQAQ